jgi:hypothetical protein
MKISVRLRKGLLGLSLVLLGMFSLPAAADAPWAGGKKYALLVGIDDYLNDSVTDLKCATADAKLLKQTLISKADFPEENIFLLSSEARGESDQPSLTNIVFRLEWLREVVGPGDTLVFYFAGHGVSMDSETFLLTNEADQRSKNTLMVSSLPGKVLQDLLKQAGAQNTLVLLDACRNDPTAGRGDADHRLSATLARGLVFKPLPPVDPSLERNSATIFACSEGERSWEWGDKNQGFFTYYLAEGLTTGAYDGEGKATLQNLIAYLREKVNAAAVRETNQRQTPMVEYSGPGADRWVLARGEATEVPVPTLAEVEKAALVARIEQAELEIKRLQAEKSLRESQEQVRLAQDSLARYQEKAKSGEAVAEKELSLAMESLQEAQQGLSTDQEKVAASALAAEELETRLKAISAAKRVYFGAQGTPEVEASRQELADYEKRLLELDREKKQAIERAVQAEARLALVQAR